MVVPYLLVIEEMWRYGWARKRFGKLNGCNMVLVGYQQWSKGSLTSIAL